MIGEGCDPPAGIGRGGVLGSIGIRGAPGGGIDTMGLPTDETELLFVSEPPLPLPDTGLAPATRGLPTIKPGWICLGGV